jgi:dihydropteroate synthase
LKSKRSPALGRGFSLSGGRLYLKPAAIGPSAAGGLALAGGPLRFRSVTIFVREPSGRVRTADAGIEELRAAARAEATEAATAVDAWLDRISAPRLPFAGLAPGRPHLMGIVNATPDSFLDRGAHATPESAIAHGRALAAAGAGLLDIGGESTRPGADPVPVEEELRRVLPVVRGLAGLGQPLSIDSRKAAVMAAALDAGAAIVNDVSALSYDPASLALVAARQAPAILMHMAGEPKTMNRAPAYDHVTLDVYDWLAARVEACLAAGIPLGRLAVDPGFGFGKGPEHNAALLADLALFHGLGCWLVVGPSGKRFGGAPKRSRTDAERDAETLAAARAAAAQGAQILRIHDVAGAAAILGGPPATHGNP